MRLSGAVLIIAGCICASEAFLPPAGHMPRLPSLSLWGTSGPLATSRRKAGIAMRVNINYAKVTVYYPGGGKEDIFGDDIKQKLQERVNSQERLVIPLVDASILPDRIRPGDNGWTLFVQWADYNKYVPQSEKTVSKGSALVLGPVGYGEWKGVPYDVPRTGPRDPQKLVWTTKDRKMTVNGQPFNLKGISWFGMETGDRYPGGLKSTDLDSILRFLKSKGFNAVRLPISIQAALSLGDYHDKYSGLKEDWLKGKSVRELLSVIVDKCGEYNILVMPSMHRMNENENTNMDVAIGQLWHNGEYTEADFMLAWDHLLDVLKHKWNVFALDLKNEPHGEARWTERSGDRPWNSWNLAAEEIANHILQNHEEYKGLFFIEGVEGSVGTYDTGYGGMIQGAETTPIQLWQGNEHRVVLSPHVYGPSVWKREVHKELLNPDGFLKVFTSFDWLWGDVHKNYNKAVAIGEWGGYNGDKGDNYLTRSPPTLYDPANNKNYDDTIDQAWHNCLRDYLIKANSIPDNFYWCLNPDSLDTGGVVYNWGLDPVNSKLDLLAEIQKNPTVVNKDGVAPGKVQGRD